VGQRILEVARLGDWLGELDLLTASRLGILRLLDLIQKGEEGIAVDHVDPAYVVNLANRPHQKLGCGTLELEDVLEVTAGPGFDY
jgi:hypothetical protein